MGNLYLSLRIATYSFFMTFNSTKMENKNVKPTKIYFIVMGVYWLFFALITILYPKFMDIFQTQAGINAKTQFSDHVFLHDGFDIIALCIILFALSGERVSRRILWGATFAALMPAIVIFYSLITTSYWNPLFIGAGLGCFVFVAWGYVLATKKQ